MTRRRVTDRRALLRRLGGGLGAAGAGALAGCGAEPDDAADATTTPAGPERPPGYGPLGELAIEGATEAVVADDGTTVAIAAVDGVALADVSDPASPRLLAERRGLLADDPDGPLEGIQDVAVDGDRLLVVGPAHDGPALNAALLYDVTDPAAPARLGVHRTDYPIHNADLDDGLAYLTANDGDRNPLAVVDVAAGERVGDWSVLDTVPAWGDVDPALRPLHDVTVTGDVATLAHWDAGTWLLDVSDPASPAAIGSVVEQSPSELAGLEDDAVGRAATELPGNDHYSLLGQTGEGGDRLLVVGREAWDADDDGAGGPGGVDLYRVPATGGEGGGAGDGTEGGDADHGGPELGEPQHAGHVAGPPTPDPSQSGPWTTAHNVGLRGGRLYTSWYYGGIAIHDVTDPTAPVELAAWRDPARAAFWTAKPARDCVVATSTAYLDGATAALFTFPDEPGRQVDPPPIGVAGPDTTTAGAAER